MLEKKSSIFSGEGSTRVIYPSPESPTDVRYLDLIEILKIALERTKNEYGSYILEPSSVTIPEVRLMQELDRGSRLDIAWSSTSIKKEAKFLPIRIPLRKGLLGYRIAIIHQSKQAHIDQVNTLEDLKKLSIGQGLGWGDVYVYKNSGFNVTTALYPNLFEMLSAGCFDLLPRGISEANTELEQHIFDNPDLAIEKNMVIYYPWPYYFFFNKKNKPLAARVESGLRDMIKDGTFELLFQKFNHTCIQQANLKNRRIIKLENTLLPPETPLNDSTLWFDPITYRE